jgi:hypothetical protein
MYYQEEVADDLNSQIVGYALTIDGSVLCPTCFDKQYTHHDEAYDTPVFADSEWDYKLVCDVCLEPIEHITILGQE